MRTVCIIFNSNFYTLFSNMCRSRSALFIRINATFQPHGEFHFIMQIDWKSKVCIMWADQIWMHDSTIVNSITGCVILAGLRCYVPKSHVFSQHINVKDSVLNDCLLFCAGQHFCHEPVWCNVCLWTLGKLHHHQWNWSQGWKSTHGIYQWPELCM